MSAAQKPWVAAPREVDHTWMSVKDYLTRCQNLLTHKDRDVAQTIFMGDSITEGWAQEGIEAWTKTWQPPKTLCLGIGGDQTQNLLWRIEQGEVRGLSPQLLLLLIGVNNLWWGGFTPEETHRGIIAVVEALRRELPTTTIAVHGILPASRSLQDDLRTRIRECNRLTEQWCNKFADAPTKGGSRIFWIDLTDTFLSPQGQLDPLLFPDFVHLSPLGYSVWAQALGPHVKRLLDQSR